MADEEELYPDELEADAPDPSKKEIHRYIEQLLPAYRPTERYSNADKGWMEPVIKLAYEEAQRHNFTLKGVLDDWCTQSVHKHEREAASKADKLMRKIGIEGRLPLGWGEGDEWRKTFGTELSLPLRLPNDQRVPFGAANLADFKGWAKARNERFMRLSDANEEAQQGFTVIEDLFKEQPNARRADHLFQPNEDEPGEDGPGDDEPNEDEKDE